MIVEIGTHCWTTAPQLWPQRMRTAELHSLLAINRQYKTLEHVFYLLLRRKLHVQDDLSRSNIRSFDHKVQIVMHHWSLRTN